MALIRVFQHPSTTAVGIYMCRRSGIILFGVGVQFQQEHVVRPMLVPVACLVLGKIHFVYVPQAFVHWSMQFGDDVRVIGVDQLVLCRHVFVHLDHDSRVHLKFCRAKVKHS